MAMGENTVKTTTKTCLPCLGKPHRDCRKNTIPSVVENAGVGRQPRTAADAAVRAEVSRARHSLRTVCSMLRRILTVLPDGVDKERVADALDLLSPIEPPSHLEAQ